MRKLAHVVLGTILAAGIAACGDSSGVAEDGAGDTPLAQIRGTIQGPAGISHASPHVGLVWVNWGDGTTMAPEFFEQITAIDATQMPVSFGLSIFQPPPPNAYNVIKDFDGTGELIRLAMGYVVALDDVDGNGSFVLDENGIAAPDLLWGASFFDALFHIPAALSPEGAEMMFTNPEAATPGFHVARIDPCDGRFTIVDDGTFALETFPATSTFPDLVVEEPSCPIDPVAGPCSDPESEACSTCLDAALTECLTVTCDAEMDALTACAEANGCELDGTKGDYNCVGLYCENEMAATELCVYSCAGWDACYRVPAEG